MIIKTDAIIGLLRNSPDGVTSAEAAKRFGVPLTTIGGRLSRLADYGVIEREWCRGAGPSGATRRWCRWKLREQSRG